MQHLEVSGAVRHIYIYIYIYGIRRLKINLYDLRNLPYGPCCVLQHFTYILFFVVF